MTDTMTATLSETSLQQATNDIEAIIASEEARYYTARDAISTFKINVLCDVLGDENPIYRDEQAAKEAGHPGVVAPPTALQVWSMSNLNEAPTSSPVDKAYDILRRAGLPKVVAVNGNQHYNRYLTPGEVITSKETVQSLSPVKQTALGVGMFITTLLTFMSDNEEVVGTMQFRTLWYAPNTSLDTLKGI